MFSELFSALIPQAHAEEQQPAKEEEKPSSENQAEGEGEAKEEAPEEEEEPEDILTIPPLLPSLMHCVDNCAAPKLFSKLK
ncbi:hypothetical protein M408DRAFT_24811 [Serendipita vermifera MAFF 305830]|uniref:Ubiquinol-cytochrome C reductase hinge domain-containing protein n=1 Tax=Serendipita vermifera MAFF 305830 TaxID=933852 RepID=A0A0C3B4E7_SERVB|nr:hypothetical protein M408DRAFT_24811 [Serendipita vermifera MAFF 305830]